MLVNLTLYPSLAAVPTNTSDVYPMTFDYSTLQPFGGQSSFHRQCFISDYDNQTDVEQCWLGTPTAPLIDLDTENSTNVDIMNNWVKNLVSDYGIDGLRIDTLKHVRKDFWPDFASSAGVYTVGEVSIEAYELKHKLIQRSRSSLATPAMQLLTPRSFLQYSTILRILPFSTRLLVHQATFLTLPKWLSRRKISIRIHLRAGLLSKTMTNQGFKARLVMKHW